MVVLDYLTANTDRHTGNYMYVMDNSTGDLIGFGKLYDFNQAFISDTLNTSIDDAISPTIPLEDITLYQLAIKYYKDSIFHKEYTKIYEILKNIIDIEIYREKLLVRYTRIESSVNWKEW